MLKIPTYCNLKVLSTTSISSIKTCATLGSRKWKCSYHLWLLSTSLWAKKLIYYLFLVWSWKKWFYLSWSDLNVEHLFMHCQSWSRYELKKCVDVHLQVGAGDKVPLLKLYYWLNYCHILVSKGTSSYVSYTLLIP